LNWYAGEASTAVIVANVPHLWPLISRLFNLGAFKQTRGANGSNQLPLGSHRSVAGIPSARRDKYNIDGYIHTGSEERIATSDDKDVQWGYSKKLDTSESSDGDLELGKGCMTTNVRAAGGGNIGGVGRAGEDEELGGWEDDRADPNKQGQIFKTVHINQYAGDP